MHKHCCAMFPFVSFVAALAISLGFGETIVAAPPAAVPPAAAKVDFDLQIRPLLSDRCFHCHGPDVEGRKGGFRLDQEKSALGTADDGEHPIVPGKPDSSELIRRITSDDLTERMPPKDSGKTLSKNDIELLRRWIQEGAKWEKHWAFVRAARPAEPPVKNPHAARNEIDRFVLARLEAEGLKPSPEANRETLIRRLSFALIGLPPTPKEINAFLADTSDQAYEKLVDRLLASPHYGERMAAQWLDGARYADTNGYQNDFARDMSPWRDWVIQAYNSNMRYDEFVVEQLAGDLLPGATQSQKVATGFLRNNRAVTEAGSIEEEWRTENMIDRVETSSAVLLGLTMGCARCHDHKYDPISQREFYSYLGFFNSTEDRGFYSETRGNTGPTVQVVRPEQRAANRRVRRVDRQGRARRCGGSRTANAAPVRQMVDDDPRQALRAKMLPVASVGLSLHGDLQVAYGKNHQPDEKVSSGSYEGGKPHWGDGLSAKALELSGELSSAVKLGEAVSLDRDSKFSIACWVRPDGAGALWSKMDGPTAFRGFDALVIADGHVEMHMIHRWMENAIKVSTKQRLRMGQWNHVCITFDGSSKASGIKIYFDGKQVPLEVNADSLTETITSERPFRLGRRLTAEFFKGALSEFGLFDRILTTDEIQSFVPATLAVAVKPQSKPDAAHDRILRDYFASQSANDAQSKANASLAKLRAEKDAYLKTAIQSVMVLEEMEQPRPAYVLKRGQYDALRTRATLSPGVPAISAPAAQWHSVNRLGLAKWLVDPANPLVARVEVNRLWQRLFGVGIVATPDNFGSQGEPPANQELLDWLATELSPFELGPQGALQKEIVIKAATFRQSSVTTPDPGRSGDPENRLLARAARDSAFRPRRFATNSSGRQRPAVAQDRRAIVVKPYQPAGLWEELAGGAGEGPYIQDSGENLHRRSLYTYRKRTVPHPTTSTFDAPTWETCTVKRSRTNTPLQALALLNDETYVEAARGLAQRMMLEGGSDVEGRLRYGFRLATCRQPEPKEIERLTAAYHRYQEAFHQDPASAQTLLNVGEFRADAKLDKTELAAYATIGSILLNLDETISNH